MNREELEKMFDEKINTLGYNAEKYIEHNERLKKIFFETIIPEVLKSMLVYEGHGINPIKEKRKYANKLIKQKAKEFYNINL